MKKYDVVIIGFGPTGGTLANLLALHGFSILIVEKEKSFYPLPRACLLYTSPSPRDQRGSRMPSSA